jgi:cation:H+ antiporter
VTQPLFELLGGFILLTAGGHYIVTGAINISKLLRISTAIAGLIVVAFGTSLPELAVSLDAASGSGADIAYANVVGSNIFNLAVILSIVAIVKPISVAPSALRIQYPAMLLVTIAGIAFSTGGSVTQIEGIVLTIGLFGFIGGTIYFSSRGRTPELAEQYENEAAEMTPIAGPRSRRWTIGLLMVVGGILGLSKGADLMVAGAVTLAEMIGVSDRMIGLTVIAMGTSLPELAAAVAASRHGDSKIILGNLLGSNIFNVLAIMGITGMVHTVPVTERALSFDNWVMLGFTLAILPALARSKAKITRFEGATVLTGFLIYFTVLVIRG